MTMCSAERLSLAVVWLLVLVSASCGSAPHEGPGGTGGGSGGSGVGGGGSGISGGGGSAGGGGGSPGVNCPRLTTKEASTVQPCSGAPTGTWLLTRLELGKTTLRVSNFGQEVGTCDAQMTPKVTTTPRLFMDLIAGGRARYFSEMIPFSLAWEESCVTSKASGLGCDEPLSRMNLFGCHLDCNICSCSGSLASMEENGTWRRTETSLTVSPWGIAADFAYCLKDDVLSLSTEAVFLTFKRVYPFSLPTPCGQRPAEVCTAGTGCRIGGCKGVAGCERQSTEGTCLTVPGCTWDPKVCEGGGTTTCHLQDYGVVPGCLLLDKPMTCAGTPMPCNARDETTCAQDKQCTLMSANTCVGGSLDCSSFVSCPDGYCSYLNRQCYGITSCEAHRTADDCNYVARIYPNSPCMWKTVHTCSGAVKPCSAYAPEACAAVAGCHLETAP